MENHAFMDKIRTFLGIRQEPPRNDFRNPIWGSDDEDDDDELYTRQKTDGFTDPLELHQEFTNQMHDMFRSFGSIFGDMRSFFQDEHFDKFDTVGTNTIDGPEPEQFQGSSIRDHYLKPNFHKKHEQQPKEDIDLDGKISSQEISGLLKQKEDGKNSGQIPFSGSMVPGRSFCKTIITTSVKKPDGSVETKRIIKNGHEIVEETTTSSVPDTQGQFFTNMDPMVPNSSIIYDHIMSELSSLFKNLH